VIGAKAPRLKGTELQAFRLQAEPAQIRSFIAAPGLNFPKEQGKTNWIEAAAA
jgi:hypothetical protein